MKQTIPAILLVLLLGLSSSASAARKPLNPVRHKNDAPTLRIANGKALIKILLEQKLTGKKHASLQLMTAKPGLVIPKHRHPNSTEILYILSGSGSMYTIEPRTGKRVDYKVKAGMAIWIPRGWEHGFSMKGQKTALTAVQVYTPAGPEQRFKKMKR